jgi:methyltransferase (TIGR00027 family)
VLDGGRVFCDPLALRILGKQAADEIVVSARRSEGRLSRAFRGPVVARSRIAEDVLHAAVASGTPQYVVLGAGLDTFAYRNPYPATLRVFEVDHPATQNWKRRLLHEANIVVPPSAGFVPVNFETQDFMHELENAGFNPDLPAVFSWLGVTVYLTREVVMSTLKRIRNSGAPGSVVVFDYVCLPGRVNLLRRGVLALLSRRFARLGEPWRSFYNEQDLSAELHAIGYHRVDHIRPDEIAKRLFASNDVVLEHRRAGRKFGGVVKAWV